ncbi:hypothetical protein [Christiangramia forsetii]|uniref:Uncharacterized protein n=2 Tax=Christiangramia forsetii TaxID=411153 RepID=A0M441_CHRFK|nr:hypothetical protein [Christiangramia forsetii]GGG24303.1 hypothetical protein GCM10011532_04420 [Christiangramia forsetii]CAL67386.1 hypothetical protein GFO_2430 [Christiangramia forsetii KT0803]
MKASQLVLMLFIVLIDFTGFGATTSDLTENSTTEIVQDELSAIVVATPDFTQDKIMVEAISSISFNSVANTEMVSGERMIENPILKSEKSEAFRNHFNLVNDVGWYTYQNDNLTPEIKNKTGGELSTFYNLSNI